MNARFPTPGMLAVAIVLMLSCPRARADPIQLTLNAPYKQNFDSLAKTKEDQVFPWMNDSTIPGWFASQVTYRVSNGGNSNPGVYSFGRFNEDDRALGVITNSKQSTNFFGATFRNKTGAILTELKVEYTGEQWRDGNTNPQTLHFSIQGDPVKELNFTSPTNNGTGSNINGNAPANQTKISFTIKNLSIKPDATFDLQWTLNQPRIGQSHGLAVDDLTVSVAGTKPATPEPSTFVLLAIGSAGVVVWKWRRTRSVAAE
jgi:hypothetical protein